jgi:hypothetical protein
MISFMISVVPPKGPRLSGLLEPSVVESAGQPLVRGSRWSLLEGIDGQHHYHFATTSPSIRLQTARNATGRSQLSR